MNTACMYIVNQREVHVRLQRKPGDDRSLRGGEKKKKGRGRRKGREEGGERRGGILEKNVQNNVHYKYWQPRVAVLTVV